MDSNRTTNENYHIFDEQHPLPLKSSGNKTREQIIMDSTILFAQRGYAAVSMRDIAKSIGIKPASLYHHFASKEALWNAVLTHTKDLYLLYFKGLDKEIKNAKTFDEALEILFLEPKKMDNVFTCYAFSLIQAEQFNNELSGEIFNDTFLDYSIQLTKNHLDECVAQSFVPEFDTKTVATLIMHSILMGVNVSVQILMGRKAPYDPCEMLADLQRLILKLVHDQEYVVL